MFQVLVNRARGVESRESRVAVPEVRLPWHVLEGEGRMCSEIRGWSRTWFRLVGLPFAVTWKREKRSQAIENFGTTTWDDTGLPSNVNADADVDGGQCLIFDAERR